MSNSVRFHEFLALKVFNEIHVITMEEILVYNKFIDLVSLKSAISSRQRVYKKTFLKKAFVKKRESKKPFKGRDERGSIVS